MLPSRAMTLPCMPFIKILNHEHGHMPFLGVGAHLFEGFWGSVSAGLGPKYCETESDMVPYTRLAPS